MGGKGSGPRPKSKRRDENAPIHVVFRQTKKPVRMKFKEGAKCQDCGIDLFQTRLKRSGIYRCGDCRSKQQVEWRKEKNILIDQTLVRY